MADPERNETTLVSETPPAFMPSSEVWNLCLELAKKHDLSPQDVLKRFIWVGETIVKQLDSDGLEVFTFTKKDGSAVAIRAFGHNGNGTSKKP